VFFLKAKDDLKVTFIYTGITLLFSLRLLHHFSTHVAGYADVWQHLWNWWWVEKALFDLHTSPFFTDYIYYPDGVSLAASCLSMFYKLVGAPIYLIFGNPITYNFFFLLSYILSGYGGYRLGLFVTQDKRASFIVGLLFSFCSFHTYHCWSHLNNIEWLPFAIVFFLKALNEGEVKYGFLTGLFFSFASLCSWYFSVFLFMFFFISLILYI